MVLAVTDNAAAAILRLVGRSPDSGVDGLRITTTVGSRAFEAALSAAGPSPEVVIERASARVYFDRSLTERLAGKELDVVVADRTAKFTLRDQ